MQDSKILYKKNPIVEIVTRLRKYFTINKQVLKKRIPIMELLTLKFPYKLPDRKTPPILTLELTNICDLKCVYCNNPLFKVERVHMSDAVQKAILSSVKKYKINRVRVGGGEPTIHPNFKNFCSELSKNTKFLSIVTNGQWKTKEKIKEILDCNFDMIEISVDAGGKEIYEASRVGASYDLLLSNLELLMKMKKERKSDTVVKLRLMIRPSNKENERKEIEFLSKYCDSLLPQLITNHPDSDYEEDVFIPINNYKNSIPHCTMPFKDLQVRSNGNIPYCQVLGSKIDDSEKLIAGHILKNDIFEIWNKEIKKFRNEHRSRNVDIIESCRGCKGC